MPGRNSALLDTASATMPVVSAELDNMDQVFREVRATLYRQWTRGTPRLAPKRNSSANLALASRAQAKTESRYRGRR